MTGRLRKWVVRVLASIGALYLLVTFTPLVEWWGRWLSGEWNDEQGDVLVVLVGSSLSDDVLADSSYWRAVYTVRAMRKVPYHRVLIVGAVGAPAIRRFIAGHGLSTITVETEEASNSTRENAVNAAKLLANEHGRIILLSSDYHCRRAVAAFAKAGVVVHPAPAPDVLKQVGIRWRRWNAFQSVALETVKFAYYKLKGWA